MSNCQYDCSSNETSTYCILISIYENLTTNINLNVSKLSKLPELINDLNHLNSQLKKQCNNPIQLDCNQILQFGFNGLLGIYNKLNTWIIKYPSIEFLKKLSHKILKYLEQIKKQCKICNIAKSNADTICDEYGIVKAGKCEDLSSRHLFYVGFQAASCNEMDQGSGQCNSWYDKYGYLCTPNIDPTTAYNCTFLTDENNNYKRCTNPFYPTADKAKIDPTPFSPCAEYNNEKDCPLDKKQKGHCEWNGKICKNLTQKYPWNLDLES
jgi:hypothetical protein